jgi:hypothetical protein
MCYILNNRLGGVFTRLCTHAKMNKKVMSVTLFQIEFRYNGLSADRIRQLNIQIEDLKSNKVTYTKRHERFMGQLQ